MDSLQYVTVTDRRIESISSLNLIQIFYQIFHSSWNTKIIIWNLWQKEKITLSYKWLIWMQEITFICKFILYVEREMRNINSVVCGTRNIDEY
jgi:hypothetical protein